MTKIVIHGAKLKCSQGAAPATLTVLPVHQTNADEQSAATVDDYKPMVNIAPFGMCQSTVNPQVVAATSAAGGVLTPQPCIPVTSAPWSPGSSVVTIHDHKALTDDSTCKCNWNGTIEITDAGTGVTVE